MSVFAMAGHVDHGKSTFLKHLTQQESDRLLEEKKRGMTIDLNFVWLDIQNKTTGIIDVPGHKDYLKNMIAGVFGAEAFIFIIAADDGWMPQSEEHFNILKALKINRGIAVITKTDLVTKERLEEVKKDVSQRLKDICLFEFNPQTSILEIKKKILELSDKKIENDSFSKLYIDRAFSPRGLGSVVTGTLTSGKIKVGDVLYLYPEKKEVLVKGLQCYQKDTPEIASVSRVAIQLGKIELSEIKRGKILSSNKNIISTKSIESEIDFNISIKKNLECWFYVGTQKIKCRVIPYKESSRFYRVKFKEAMPLMPLEKFILRDSGDEKTMGFGTVVDTRLTSNKHALSIKALQRWQPTLKGYFHYLLSIHPKIDLNTLVFTRGDLKEIIKDFYLLDEKWLTDEKGYLAEKEKWASLQDKEKEYEVEKKNFLSKFQDVYEPFLLEKSPFVQKMIQKKDVVYLSDGHYLAQKAYQVLASKVENYIKTHNGKATTSELREHMALSRKYAIMILETLDRNRLTYLKEGVRKLLK